MFLITLRPFRETKAAVRKYQIDLLKYYYAVIDCDTEATATAIYEQCDGFQFETSGLKMDLRFIPDDMEFEVTRRFIYIVYIPEEPFKREDGRIRRKSGQV